jgi:hypothetical protein
MYTILRDLVRDRRIKIYFTSCDFEFYLFEVEGIVPSICRLGLRRILALILKEYLAFKILCQRFLTLLVQHPL